MTAKQEHGHIVSLMPAVQGDQLEVAASIGATTLVVGDVADFDEGGGFVQVAGVVYGYSGVDDDTSAVYLTSGLTAAADADEPVQIWDNEMQAVVTEYVALVMLDYMTSGDPLEAGVSHELIDLLEENTRALVGESVTVEWGDDDDLTVVAVHGKRPVNKAIEAAVDPLDANLAQLQIDLDANNADLAAIQGMFPITSTNISDSAITTPKLAANSVTADKIVANSIGADKIIANSIGADKLTANAIDGKTITGATMTGGTVRTNPAGNRIQMRDDGSAGIVEFFTGESGETGGKVNPGSDATSHFIDIITSRPSGRTSAKIRMRASSAISAPLVELLNSTDFTVTGSTNLNSGLNVIGSSTFSNQLHANILYSDVSAGGGLTGASIDDNGKILRTTSSRRRKDNIETLTDDAIDRVVDGFRAVTFTRKDSPGVYVGGIAEEVAELDIPELVFHNADDEIEGIHYDGLAAVALAAVQRESARKDQQIADLTAQLAALADRLSAIEAAA